MRRNLNKLPYLSPSVIVYGRFPDAFLHLPNIIGRVSSIEHADGARRNPMTQYVLEKIAKRIIEEESLIDRHRGEARRRRKQKNPDAQNATTENNLLNELMGDVQIPENADLDLDDASEEFRCVPRLSFLPIDVNTVIRTHIFPRTFYCSCGHLEAIDPQNPPTTLTCPCCSNGQLRQEVIVFGCSRCANIHELTPKGAMDPATKRRKTIQLGDFLGGAPPCPDCTKGHLHLEKKRANQVEDWEWRCQTCKQYRENVEDQCLICALRGTDEDAASVIRMTGFTATAAGVYTPLLDSQMFVGDSPIDPQTVHSIAQQAGQNWEDYFDLQQAISDGLFDRDQVDQIQNACIANVYLMKDMSVVTTTYGYRAGSVMNHPLSPVAPEEREAILFRDPIHAVEYLCYGMINKGAALVIELDPGRVLERLGLGSPTEGSLAYWQHIEQTRKAFELATLRDLLEGSDRQLLIFRALHALEHAMLSSARRLIGDDVLGSKLFLEKAMLLIYEREASGRGGVVQVINEGKGLLALLADAQDHVAGCAQGCRDGDRKSVV